MQSYSSVILRTKLNPCNLLITLILLFTEHDLLAAQSDEYRVLSICNTYVNWEIADLLQLFLDLLDALVSLAALPHHL